MSVDRTTKAKQFLQRIAGPGALESLESDASAIERLMPARTIPDELLPATLGAATKIATGEQMTPAEQFALEAIIIPDKRPAVDILNGDFQVVHPLWTGFNSDPIKQNIKKTIPSIGRIELPHHPTLPYGGTGFVVGVDLLMTNRHVAEIFCSGLGLRDLKFLPGREAGVDFLQEKGSITSRVLSVREILMIHPYWDMALLRVEGLTTEQTPLTLSLKHPEDLAGEDVAVIGYPAFDPRNDANVQNSVFGGVYYVKRLQPGKVGARRSIQSFGKDVSAATHDSSTLGGNSGSAVIQASTGHVIGLHFAGVYLDANYAVPTSELARDRRVVDTGVNFLTQAQPEANIWDSWWRSADSAEEATRSNATALPPRAPKSDAQRVIASVQASANPDQGSHELVSLTIPLHITVRLGSAAAGLEHEKVAAEEPDQTRASSLNVVQSPRSALHEGPLTFRDHFLSLFQSAVADLAGKVAADKRARLESTARGGASELISAAEAVAQNHAGGRAISQPLSRAPGTESALEKMSLPEHAAACASLGLQLMQAKVLGDTATVSKVEGELNAGTCDPRWAQTITEYAKYFGINGTRARPRYVTPLEAGDKVITISRRAKIGLLGDWGTGAEAARRVLEHLRQTKPDILVHLGDIYYSGTEMECQEKFEGLINDVFDRGRTKLPVYTLSGNHDMYCGGVGYYALIERLNNGLKDVNGRSMVQPASFFCLRAEDATWQLLAMDTGRNDYSPFSVTDVVTFVEGAEQEWLSQRLREFKGKTILLSHHQLFSAFSQIGGRTQNGKLNPINPKLHDTYKALTATGRPIPAWFWGHEHNLCIYQPYAALARGRCLGHSAIPVFADDTPYDPLPRVENPPQLIDKTKLSVSGQFYTHGFAVLTLGANGPTTADYFEDFNGVVRRVYSESID